MKTVLLYISAAAVLHVMVVPTIADERVALISKINICEGDDIPLTMTFEDGIDEVSQAKIFKNGYSYKTLMIVKDRKEPFLNDSRLDYRSPTEVILKNATKSDTGPYETHVIFEENQTGWHRFQVEVSEGCPNKAEFYDTDMYVSKYGKLQYLSPKDTILMTTNEIATLNISLPQASPPIRCTVISDGRETESDGSAHKTSYVFATLNFKDVGNYTVEVQLEHVTLRPVSSRTINVVVDSNAMQPGYPDKGRFYDFDVFYAEAVGTNMVWKPGDNLRIAMNTLIVLNISIPKASPPVLVEYVKDGTRRTAEGSQEELSFWNPTLLHKKTENFSIVLRMRHPILTPDSEKVINVVVGEEKWSPISNITLDTNDIANMCASTSLPAWLKRNYIVAICLNCLALVSIWFVWCCWRYCPSCKKKNARKKQVIRSAQPEYSDVKSFNQQTNVQTKEDKTEETKVNTYDRPIAPGTLAHKSEKIPLMPNDESTTNSNEPKSGNVAIGDDTKAKRSRGLKK